MPTCVSCGQHYKLSKDYNDVLECEDCSCVINEDLFEDDPLEVTQDELVIGDGCYRAVVKRYDQSYVISDTN